MLAAANIQNNELHNTHHAGTDSGFKVCQESLKKNIQFYQREEKRERERESKRQTMKYLTRHPLATLTIK